MIHHERLRLDLTEDEVEGLLKGYRKVVNHLEKGYPLALAVLEDLKGAMSRVIAESEVWRELLDKCRNSGDFYCIHLLHSRNDILNLPWSMALDPVSGGWLGANRRLLVSKCISGYYGGGHGTEPVKAPSPLKILLMIASPELTREERKRGGHGARLSYEQEELEILKAFEPLWRSGEVEVDFTEDGSMEALERKLKGNRYHILHVTGHASYDKESQTGYLQLEDPMTLKPVKVSGEAFAEGVNCNVGYRAPLVVLSCCQTAAGTSEDGIRGITNHLLKNGVPAVISMGLSITDHYAALFGAHLYGVLAQKRTLLEAFNEALQGIKEAEAKDRVQMGLEPTPLQWLIPNLYLSGEMENVVDWGRPREQPDLTSSRYLLDKNRLLLKHEADYLFIGRRPEKAALLRPFFHKQPILLTGQGGVGKTAMAEHLVQRLIAYDPKTEPFVFNEASRSIADILDRMRSFLLEKGKGAVVGVLNGLDKAMDQFTYMLAEIRAVCRPVFVFDNLESFQAGIGKGFSPQYADLAEVIGYLCEKGLCHVLLTCRYGLPDIESLKAFEMRQVGEADYLKRGISLDVGRLKRYFSPFDGGGTGADDLAVSRFGFREVMALLHEVFGGNYRVLEFFNELVREAPGKIVGALESLERFRGQSEPVAEAVRKRMGENLVFRELMGLLGGEAKGVLGLLSHFRVPARRVALEGQLGEKAGSMDLDGVLERLRGLTLLEASSPGGQDEKDYYVTPIVRDLYREYMGDETKAAFSHELAGGYFYDLYKTDEGGLTELEEAFYHYDEAGNKEMVGEIGERLTAYYYKTFMYNNVFFYAGRVYEVLGEETEVVVLNRLAIVYKLYGDNDRALSLFEKALEKVREQEDKKAESTLLNNISQIYDARGEYERALEFLEQDLKICREIGDKAGEGTTLNNISQIYDARGDYERALKLLEQSLTIRREIGDKAGEGTTLNNISQIYKARGDYERALEFLEQSLTITREIGDKAGEGTTLNNISQIYSARGDYERALELLEQSLTITREIGDKSQVAYTLFNMGMAYANEKINQPEKAAACFKEVMELNAFLKDARLTEALKGLSL